MVSSGTVIAVGLLAAFGIAGGASLVRPAIANARKTKDSLSNRISQTRATLKEGSKSG